ncbi:MAG: hypothetical protein GPJ08_07195 [Microcystis aeruginosa G13-09]|nr:hypothetical protein [Microcystis aeruginosa G13-09]
MRNITTNAQTSSLVLTSNLDNENQIKSQVEAGNDGKVVAIDLETGDFELDKSEIAACERLESRHPDAQIWIVRIGSPYVRKFGGRAKRTA